MKPLAYAIAIALGCLATNLAEADDKPWHLQPMDSWLPGECYRSPHAETYRPDSKPVAVPKLAPFWLKKGQGVRWLRDDGKRWYLKEGDFLTVEKVEQYGRVWSVGLRNHRNGIYCHFYSDEIVKGTP